MGQHRQGHFTPDSRRRDMAKKLGVDNFMVIDDASNIAASTAMQQRLKWKNDVEVRTLP